jgi:hypothetical protein
MKWLVVLCRSLLTLALAVLLVAATAYLAGEVAVAWYMQHYSVAARVDLSNDMGFGMLGFLYVGLLRRLHVRACVAPPGAACGLALVGARQPSRDG